MTMREVGYASSRENNNTAVPMSYSIQTISTPPKTRAHFQVSNVLSLVRPINRPPRHT